MLCGSRQTVFLKNINCAIVVGVDRSQRKCCVYTLKLLIFVNVFAADDMNWNALEWDRAAEELTWERVTLSARRCIF